MRSNKWSRIIAACVCAVMVFGIFACTGGNVVRADDLFPTITWPGGSQVSYILCNSEYATGYDSVTITITVSGGTITSASGWGVDSVTHTDTTVTATVLKNGKSPWVYKSGSLGVQFYGDYTSFTYSASGTASASATTQTTTSATTQATTRATTQATTAAATQATTRATQATTQEQVQTATQATAQTEAQNNSGNTNNNQAAANSGNSADTDSGSGNAGNGGSGSSGNGAQAAAVVSGTSATTKSTTHSTTSKDEDTTTEASTETESTVVAAETHSNGDRLLVVGEVEDGESYDETSVLDATHADGSHVVVGLVSATGAEAGRGSITSWLWLIILILICGAGYFRYRQLRSKDMRGSQLVINFIPGVAGLCYTIKNIGPSNHTIASDASATQNFNTASAMKELRQMKEANEKEELAGRAAASTVKPQTHAPIKRPKELSVNHAAAAAVKSAPASTPVPAAATVAATVARATETTQAAGKETAGSAVTRPSVARPASAGTAAQPSAANSAAAQAARERADAAREQQAMRKAMQDAARAQKEKTEAESKSQEIRQHAPIKRPKELSVNRNANPVNSSTQGTAPAMTQPVNNNQLYSGVSSGAPRTMSNAAQLTGAMSGSSATVSGRAPVWSAPGRNVNPFKSTVSEPVQASAEAAAPEAKSFREKEEHHSIADQKTHKSAFFGKVSQTKTSAATEDVESVYGGIVRPSAVVDDSRLSEVKPTAPAMGAALEGRRPAILSDKNECAPTASVPPAGFKNPNGL